MNPYSGDVLPLSEQECWGLLHRVSVGRIGFHDAEGVKILPVNFVAIGDQLILRTAPLGTIAGLAAAGDDVAFEVDDHSGIGDFGCSVLLLGRLDFVTAAQAQQLASSGRRLPWVVDDARALALCFTYRSIDGRRIHHRQT